jgi:CheY-like chemotaxis protein
VAVQGEATRELLRELLASAAFDVVEVSNGSETLAKVKALRPAVVLVDVGLSDMPGFQVCEAVRGDAANTGVKMILVAAIHNKDRYRRPPDKLFGADDYIERHQIESDLINKVNQLCGGGPPADAGPAGPARTPEAVPAGRATAPAEPSTSVASPPSGSGRALGVVRAEAAQAPTPAPPREATPVPPAQGQPISAPPAAVGSRAPVTTPPVKEAAVSPPPAPTNPAQEAALRLARIIVSDIALYNAKKVDDCFAPKSTRAESCMKNARALI